MDREIDALADRLRNHLRVWGIAIMAIAGIAADSQFPEWWVPPWWWTWFLFVLWWVPIGWLFAADALAYPLARAVIKRRAAAKRR